MTIVETGSPGVAHPFREAAAAITVIGVGGGGCNAVTRMMKEKSVPGVNYICVNTDIKSLGMVQGAKVLQIGDDITHGLGAGGNPEVGGRAAKGSHQELMSALNRKDLVFVTAGMGGGTGTGAAPVVAEIARNSGALVVGVVTTPFSWEGHRRLELAMAGVGRLKEKVDNLIVIHNDRLLKMMSADISMEEALKRADEAVMYGVLSVAELINVPGEINVDMADVRAIMKMPGRALMSIGEAKGPNGMMECAKTAVTNTLLDVSIDGAQGVLFCVNGGPKLTLGEVNAAGQFIASRVTREAVIFFGMVNDPTMDDRVRLTVIATGIPETSSDGKTLRSFGVGARPTPALSPARADGSPSTLRRI
ncbi:MAG: cell division protein FtsZ [Chloroflexi bacterium]|nr:cell division protein FtsZ [Chloroflexota bacterium]